MRVIRNRVETHSPLSDSAGLYLDANKPSARILEDEIVWAVLAKRNADAIAELDEAKDRNSLAHRPTNLVLRFPLVEMPNGGTNV